MYLHKLLCNKVFLFFPPAAYWNTCVSNKELVLSLTRTQKGRTNIDGVDIGSCLWHPTFVVDTDGGRRLRESTRMKMVTQVKRCKIAYA